MAAPLWETQQYGRHQFYQSLRAGEASGDLERDPTGDPEDCLGDLRERGGDSSMSDGGDLLRT